MQHAVRDGDEYPRAYITLKAGKTATEEDIVNYMKGKVAPTKRITGGVVFIDAIPRNPSGKILRKALRERAAQEVKQGISSKL
jgi:acyl-coenzyme A synthetase/AMP-(fatty) acid ligase